jgi:hypothetical protein
LEMHPAARGIHRAVSGMERAEPGVGPGVGA